MKKNNGFTLIELLAVIVILAVIAVISVPLITGVIEKAQASAYKESLRGIFGATDLYIASANFNGFPNDGINITDSSIQMKNKSFTSGKIIKNAEGKLELDKVSNGSYCGSGPIDNLVIIEGSCDSLDETAPTGVTLTSNLVASNSVTIVASATDLESGISGYQFSKDNGLTWTNKQTSNIYTFTGLTNNTSYTFKVKVYNNNLLSTISNEISETTTNVEVPTYTINPTGWTKSAVVTITYPERESGYIYEYSLDEGLSWEEVASPDVTKDITFNENGSVIARINDGVNEVVGTTYQVTNIDNVAPIITVNPETVEVTLGSTYVDTGVTAIDNVMGDVTSRIVTTGSVDVNTVGTYALTYNVSDEAGNAAIEVTRTIEVVVVNIALDFNSSAEITNNFDVSASSSSATLTYDAGTAKFTSTQIDQFVSATLKTVENGINNIQFSLGVWLPSTGYLTNSFWVKFDDDNVMQFYFMHQSSSYSQSLPLPSAASNFVVSNGITGAKTSIGSIVSQGYHTYNINVINGNLTMNADTGHSYTANIGTRKIVSIGFHPTHMWWNTGVIGRLDWLKYTLQ